jgi:hypothetical protein
MKMDFEELKERVKRGRYSVVKLVYGNNKSHTEKAALYCLDEEFIPSQLDDFGKTFKGDFTAYLKQSKGQSWKNAEVINFTLGFADYEILSSESELNSSSYADMKAQILAEIKADQDKQIQGARIEELEAERERAKTISVQLAAVGGELLKQLFPKQMQAINQTFNGTNSEQMENERFNEMNEENLVNAYEDLTELFGAENLPKIVAKMKQQPHLVQMVLGMI